MHECPAELIALLSQARAQVADDRYLWCTAAETFESRILQRRGLLLGGAVSPHFLRDTTADSWGTPWMVRLRRARVIVCSEAAQHPLATWLPLMEARSSPPVSRSWW